MEFSLDICPTTLSRESITDFIKSYPKLDEAFIGVLNGKMAIGEIVPADNAGLGLARALSVVKALKTNERLKTATILPMSAAQLILPGEELTKGQAGDVESRRRIEIRVRRRNSPINQSE